MLIIFLIFVISYIIGNIKINGISFGSSAIILISLIFGHYGFEISPDIRNLGLLLFVCSVGLSCGPTFINHFRKNAKSYIFNGLFTIAFAALVTILIIKLFSIDIHIALGLFTGALTSTPGFAIASELSKSNITTAAYGISYPFGVVGVTLFCQIMSKKTNKNTNSSIKDKYINKKIKVFDSSGLLNFSITMFIGILLGMIKIPLLGGYSFSFGNSGGPLIAGIIIGSIGKIGSYDLSVKDEVLGVLKNFGLSLFLLGSGLQAGKDIVSIINEYGIMLFFLGAIITLSSLLFSYFLTSKVFKLSLINSLGSVCGAMTSTPALGSLSSNIEDESVLSSYAATYPISLISVILFSQILYIFFS